MRFSGLRARDGVIGFGSFFQESNLSTGVHTIRARVSDGQNTVQSPAITLTIGSGGGGGGGGGGGSNQFVDDNGHIFENAITWLAGKGITQGCNPPTNNRFCPDDPVSRGQMAVFLVRAFDYSDNGGGNIFVDDNGLFTRVGRPPVHRRRDPGMQPADQQPVLR